MKPIVHLRNALLLFAFFLASVIGFVSCRHEPVDLSQFPPVCFETKVLPVFLNSCAISGCHNGGESDYNFSTYKGILDAVVAGSPSKSPAYTAITAFWGEQAMPPDQPISEENRTNIRIWIEQGALDNSCSDNPGGVDSSYYNSRACFQRDIYPIILSNCAMSGCHDGASNHEGERLFSLKDYKAILKIVVPKHPKSSSIYKVIKGSGEDLMPPSPNKPLNTAQIDSIYNWINYGALNENCGDLCDTSATATYNAKIWPLIQKNCYGCHNGANAQKGIHLEKYQDVASLANNGKLVGALKGQQGFVKMPPGTSLSFCNISQIEKWISGGSPNN